MNLDLVTLVVDEYDTAIEFFVHTLGFDLVADAPAQTENGERKRWVVVRPPGAETGILLARGADERQASVVGAPSRPPGRLLPSGRRLRRFLSPDEFGRCAIRPIPEERTLWSCCGLPRLRGEPLGPSRTWTDDLGVATETFVLHDFTAPAFVEGTESLRASPAQAWISPPSVCGAGRRLSVHQVVGGGSWASTPLSMTSAVGLPFENHLALCRRKGSPYQPWALKELGDMPKVYPTFTWMSRYVHF